MKEKEISTQTQEAKAVNQYNISVIANPYFPTDSNHKVCVISFGGKIVFKAAAWLAEWTWSHKSYSRKTREAWQIQRVETSDGAMLQIKDIDGTCIGLLDRVKSAFSDAA